MNTLQTRKLSIQSLLFAATLFAHGFAFSAEKQSNIAPLTRAERAGLSANSNNGFLTDDLLAKYPSIKILEKQPEGKRYGVCHNYAISKTLGLKGQIPETLPIIGAEDWHENIKFTEKYCQEVSTPQPGDLVTYHDNSWLNLLFYKDHTIRHTAIAHGNDIVESKWGANTQVLIHPTFHTPTSYGNQVKFYRIIKPTDEIIDDIKNIIPNYTYDTECIYYNNELVKYAEQSNNNELWDSWQRQMCLSVEASNSKGQSLLMIGAKKNNSSLVQVAMQHGADLDKRDKKGQTAIDLATKKKHSSIVQMIQQQKIKDQKIKDNEINAAKESLNKKSFLRRIAKRIAKNPHIEESLWQS